MQRMLRMLAVAAFALASLAASAQSPTSPSAPVEPPAGNAPRSPAAKSPADCPPGVNEQKAPTLDNGTTGAGRSLSDQLAQSHGVVCPPAGVDPGIVETPPPGGAMRVIPPPGSPGGDPGVQPK